MANDGHRITYPYVFCTPCDLGLWVIVILVGGPESETPVSTLLSSFIVVHIYHVTHICKVRPWSYEKELHGLYSSMVRQALYLN